MQQSSLRRNFPSPYSQRMSKSAPCSPLNSAVVRKPPVRAESFHIIHKIPLGDTPYSKAKHVQLVEKDPERAIALFWAAINAGDRVDSALKDMAIVMKQQNRAEEAIEAIKSLRDRCSDQSQESLDNVLLDLYKRCGRLDDQIALLKHKLNLISQGVAFNGKRTKTARSQGKKFQVTIEQESTRLLGNLGWAYMQKNNYTAAEAAYRKALSIEQDNNKICNLGICLMKQGRIAEAKAMLRCVKLASPEQTPGTDSHLKSYERAQEMLREIEKSQSPPSCNLSREKPQKESKDSLNIFSFNPWNSKECPKTEPDYQNLQNPTITPANISTRFASSPSNSQPQGHFCFPEPFTSSPLPKLWNSFWEEINNRTIFADENQNINTINLLMERLPYVADFELRSQAQTLISRLQQVCPKENGIQHNPFAATSPSPEHDHNISAFPLVNKQENKDDLPFKIDTAHKQNFAVPISAESNSAFVNHKNFYSDFKKENRPSPRRCLYFGNTETKPLIQPEQNHMWSSKVEGEQEIRPLAKANSVSLPFQKKDIEEAILAAICDWDPIVHQDKVQKRLRVFQEITLPATP